ncbi:hypothetical protein KBD61_00180 [Patescibacteria group bacterium]|nr:hypothetical protein [Patescibacteria group bacterium]MBP9709427.1 hypothetical protein [Patescibacteria group bacterium]
MSTIPIASSRFGESRLDIYLRRAAYTILGGLVLFDALNFFQVLPYKVEFTLFGRIVSTGGAFLALAIADALFKKHIGRALPGIARVSFALIIIGDFFGDVFHFYGSWDRYDQAIHFLSGPFLVAPLIALLGMIKNAKQWRVPDGILYLLALGINVTIAVLYEVEEYLEDFFTLSQRLGDGPDTANDMMVNLIGGAGCILAILAYKKIKHSWYSRKGFSVPVHIISPSH